MIKQRIVFIVNPISGTTRKSGAMEAIAQQADRERYLVEVCRTERPGHATLLARQAAERGADTVVAVGGDGTVNEVARALVHTDTALGIVPCGSGNGLARHLELPLTPRGAVGIINEGVVHQLDYCRINGIPFFCTCGVGFDALVSMKFAEDGRRGLLTYVKSTVEAGLAYKPETYVLENSTGTLREKAFLIACANASQYGNNAYIAPDASMKDGLMDVVLIRPFPPAMGPQVALQMFGGTLENNRHVFTFRDSRLRIVRPREGVVHVDGDPVTMGRELEIELMPGALRVVVNAHRRRQRPVLSTLEEHLRSVFRLPA